jgi:acyl carrier protein
MDVKNEIRNYLYNERLKNEFDALDDDDSLLEKGIIDSVRMLDLMGFLEENFRVKVNDEDLYPENFDSLNAIAAYIQRRQNG